MSEIPFDPDEISQDIDQLPRELSGKALEWYIPPETIEAMNDEQLRMFLIELNERVARLYDAMMLEVQSQETGGSVKQKDIDEILNPETKD